MFGFVRLFVRELHIWLTFLALISSVTRIVATMPNTVIQSPTRNMDSERNWHVALLHFGSQV